MPVREKALPSVTRGAGAPSPSRQGPCLCSNRQRWAGRRKEIKPVLKEGHLAGEEKGIRNPLLWGAFKWGGNPRTGLHSPGPLRPHTSSHTASQPSPPAAARPAQGWGTGSHPLVGWPPFHPLLRVPDLGLPVLPAAWRRHHTRAPSGDAQSHLHGQGCRLGTALPIASPHAASEIFCPHCPGLAPVEFWGPEMTPKGHLVQRPPPATRSL